MKSILKILFALALAVTTLNYIKVAPDALTATITATIGVVLMAMILPVKHLHVNELYAVTPVKVWQAYIIEKLRRMNDWLMRSSDATAKVLAGSTVYIPQAGNDPVVEVNATTYPGTAVNREDSDVNYALDIFRTVPHRVPWAELQDISYDKLDSVLAAHTNTLIEAIGDSMLIRWAAIVAAQQITTTGADVSGVGNQTGTRKGFSHKDLMKAMIKFNTQNVPKQGRVCVIDDNMYEYFYDEMTDKQFNAFNQFANNQTGQLGRLHSFDIYSRSAVLNYGAASLTPNAYAAAQLATDNLASLCWHSDFVERAQGEIKRFYNKDLAIEYGDLTSAIVKFGGRKKRSDNVGVISIIQGA
jgi:hypothetical protein